MAQFPGLGQTSSVSDPPPVGGRGEGAPQNGGGGQGVGNNTAAPTVGRGATWIIGLILIPCAILFLVLLLQLWPPPKPREGFNLAFEQGRLEVAPGSPATYTIFLRAPSTFSDFITLEAIILPEKLPHTFVPHGQEPTKGLLVPSASGSFAVLQTRPLKS
jgi:hypothetical protein